MQTSTKTQGQPHTQPHTHTHTHITRTSQASRSHAALQHAANRIDHLAACIMNHELPTVCSLPLAHPGALGPPAVSFATETFRLAEPHVDAIGKAWMHHKATGKPWLDLHIKVSGSALLQPLKHKQLKESSHPVSLPPVVYQTKTPRRLETELSNVGGPRHSSRLLPLTSSETSIFLARIDHTFHEP